MTQAEARELKPGDRLMFQKWDSLDQELRQGVCVEFVELRTSRIPRGKGLPSDLRMSIHVKWNGDICELLARDYLDCLRRAEAQAA